MILPNQRQGWSNLVLVKQNYGSERSGLEMLGCQKYSGSLFNREIDRLFITRITTFSITTFTHLRPEKDL